MPITIQKNRLFEVPNLKKDDRFKDLPYVKSKPHFTDYLGAPLADPNGNIIGVLCVPDHKERKASTNQKNQLKILAKQVIAHFELHELNKHKMNLMKILSHDIRPPPGGIIGMSSLLTETVEFDDPDTMQILQILAQSARQMNVMINDILNYTIMEAKGFTLNLKQTDIRYIVENIKKLYKPTAALKDIDLEFQVRNIENALLLDSEKFEQIFGNLLCNAIKFSHQGGIVQSIIELETMDTDTRHLILSVRDNGIGMHKNMLHNLFVDHTDNHRPGTTGEKSTGLGLSII
jgi:two-component system, sensor histidine kinase